ncbi:MAG: hypothetical protein V1778_05455 [bacterium]
MKKNYLLILLVVVLSPQWAVAASAETWKTYTDSAISFRYPLWPQAAKDIVPQTATAAIPSIAVNKEGYCAFTMAVENKGVTGDFTKTISSRLAERAAAMNGTVIFKNISSSTFESQVSYSSPNALSPLIQYTYGVRALNGKAYYLAYTSDMLNFEGYCKQLMLTTIASVQRRVSLGDPINTKIANATIVNPRLGTIVSTKNPQLIPKTTFKNKQQLCISFDTKKSIAKGTLNRRWVNTRTRGIVSELLNPKKVLKGSMTGCETITKSTLPAGGYQYRLYLNEKLIAKLAFTVK